MSPQATPPAPPNDDDRESALAERIARVSGTLDDRPDADVANTVVEPGDDELLSELRGRRRQMRSMTAPPRPIRGGLVGDVMAAINQEAATAAATVEPASVKRRASVNQRAPVDRWKTRTKWAALAATAATVSGLWFAAGRSTKSLTLAPMPGPVVSGGGEGLAASATASDKPTVAPEVVRTSEGVDDGGKGVEGLDQLNPPTVLASAEPERSGDANEVADRDASGPLVANDRSESDPMGDPPTFRPTPVGGPMLVMEVRGTPEGDVFGAVAETLDRLGFDLNAVRAETDGASIGGSMASDNDEGLATFQVFRITAAARRIDRLHLALSADRSNVAGIGLSIATDLPVEASPTVSTSPTRVRDDAMVQVLTDRDDLATAVDRLTFAPLPTDGQMSLSAAAGGGEDFREPIILVIRSGG